MSLDFARLALELGVGLGAGIVSGLMGIGGGPVLIPAAIFLLAVDQHTAQGVSLAVIAPTAIAGAFTHYRHGFIIPKIAIIVAPVAVVCALIGAQVAGMIDSLWLGRGVGALIVVIGLKMFLGK